MPNDNRKLRDNGNKRKFTHARNGKRRNSDRRNFKGGNMRRGVDSSSFRKPWTPSMNSRSDIAELGSLSRYVVLCGAGANVYKLKETDSILSAVFFVAKSILSRHYKRVHFEVNRGAAK